MMAVADGHGDKKHDRSQHGSFFGVRSVQEAFFPIARLNRLSSADPALRSALLEDKRQYFLHHFALAAERHWRGQVLEHAAMMDKEEASAPVAAELPQSSEEDPYRETLLRYGTTLLGAMAYESTLYLAQLGDGAILLLHPDGRVETPTRVENNLLGTETYSISSSPEKTLDRWGLATMEIIPGSLLLLATDGLADAFDTEDDLHRWVVDVHKIARDHTLPKVAERLPEWLETISRNSIGDDITLTAATFDPALVSTSAGKPE